MLEFKLPDLGEGMQEAEIRRWLVKPGDVIKLDSPMVEVETDKAVVEIPSPVAGRVATIRVPEGTVAKLGEVLVVFDMPTNGTGPQSPSVSEAAPAVAAASNSHISSQINIPIAKHHRILAAPAVRKRAFELGIELVDVTPSHPSGRITMEDVLKYEASPSSQVSAMSAVPAAIHTNYVPEVVIAQAHPHTSPLSVEQERGPDTTERQPLRGLRKRIAEHMERSWRTIPHATAFDEVDGSELVALRRVLKPLAEQRGVALTYVPLLVKLLLPVLKEFPVFNASFDEAQREIVYKRAYHIGIATDSPEGLLVPVLRNADQRTVLQIASELKHLIDGAQKRTLSVPEVTGSTFTLNNVGSFGGSSGTPIINTPEVAILLIGRLQEKAIVQSGTIVARTMLPLTLSFDHRVIDGALAGRFLARFKELVEHPQQLMLDMV